MLGENLMAERLPCCVPFCRRTIKGGEFAEWICGEHWRLVRRDRRMVYARYRRLWRRSGKTQYVGACNGTWSALKREAVEAAAGIR